MRISALKLVAQIMDNPCNHKTGPSDARYPDSPGNISPMAWVQQRLLSTKLTGKEAKLPVGHKEPLVTIDVLV